MGIVRLFRLIFPWICPSVLYTLGFGRELRPEFMCVTQIEAFIPSKNRICGKVSNSVLLRKNHVAVFVR